ncbi:hypothetical protein [Planctomycetes bacterium Poly30]|uniref:hypothetical protein n=1 Tax=Saltatorellus ferox TaxID=2528018 RepID=UPI0011A78812
MLDVDDLGADVRHHERRCVLQSGSEEGIRAIVPVRRRLSRWGSSYAYWLLGDQSVGSTHFYQATDLPTNTFGYAVIGTAFANINNPAGSLGRVCVPGGGRYVNQIASSGAAGMLTTTMDPMIVPTPTGFISMQVGETWGVQYWHRDVAPGGMPSSNFSTACQMQFTN